MQEQFRELAKKHSKTFEEVHAAWDQSKAELKRKKLRSGPTWLGKMNKRVDELLSVKPEVKAPAVEVKAAPAAVVEAKIVVNPMPDKDVK
jgi:hypothetical protein